MLEGAVAALDKLGVSHDDVEILHTPGAFELPVAAKSLLKNRNSDAVICLGCVIKGDTQHDEYINNSVATGLSQLSILSGKPIIFGLLTVNNLEQALERSGGKHGNKGIEAAVTAVKMADALKKLSSPKGTIGFI